MANIPWPWPCSQGHHLLGSAVCCLSLEKCVLQLFQSGLAATQEQHFYLMDVWPVPSSSQLFALNSPIILRSCFLNVKHLPILEPSPCLVPTSCSFHLSIHFQPGLSRIFRYAFCIYSTVTNTTMTIETQCVGKSFVLAVSTSPAFVIFQSFKCGGGF